MDEVELLTAERDDALLRAERAQAKLDRVRARLHKVHVDCACCDVVRAAIDPQRADQEGGRDD